MNFSAHKVRIRRVGSHDTINGGGVGTSNVILFNESAELRVIADPLDNGDGEEPEIKENLISQHPGFGLWCPNTYVPSSSVLPTKRGT